MQTWKEWKVENNLPKLMENVAQDAATKLINAAKECYKHDALYLYCNPLGENNLETFLMYQSCEIDYLLETTGLFDSGLLSAYLMDEFYKKYGEEFHNKDDAKDEIENLVNEYDFIVYDAIEKEFTEENVIKLLQENPHYKNIFMSAKKRRELQMRIRSEIDYALPKNVAELYDRPFKRHFILHAGPTNSGKTYRAIQDLKESGNGVYLAPLRLLAYEMYERMTESNIPCNMITGEEAIAVDDAEVSSMTIEMLDLEKIYEVAVIDEAQMITDKDRGAAWSSAILGVNAKTVHVCMAPNAENLIIGLINLCGDAFEVEHCERLTKLLPAPAGFHFPENVQKGDALIVFSKKNVHACASELQSKGFKCSIIYGNLPYEVRHNELKRFENGETNVLVSTDAIGMGINVPIKRIVFLETEKFDGTSRRGLLSDEVKQIAGRAGRYGIYDVGYYTSEYNRKLITKKYNSPSVTLERAYIGFPESLITLPFDLSKIINEWKKSVPDDLFLIAPMETQIQLIDRYEQICKDKRLLYNISKIPVKVDDPQMITAMDHVVLNLRDGKKIKLDELYKHQNFECMDKVYQLEQVYSYLDLMYNCISRFGEKEDLGFIIDEKKQVCERIAILLKEKKLEARTCRECKRKLPWNYPYNLCQECYDKLYGCMWDEDWGDFF